MNIREQYFTVSSQYNRTVFYCLKWTGKIFPLWTETGKIFPLWTEKIFLLCWILKIKVFKCNYFVSSYKNSFVQYLTYKIMYFCRIRYFLLKLYNLTGKNIDIIIVKKIAMQIFFIFHGEYFTLWHSHSYSIHLGIKIWKN